MFLQRMADFFYPRFCLHCDRKLVSQYRTFCQICLEHFSLISPHVRCPYCFKEACRCHLLHFSTAKRRAALWMRLGACATWISSLEKGEYAHLPSTVAFMQMQMALLQWPMPECIVPLPFSPWRSWKSGGNLPILLAKQCAKKLQSTFVPALRVGWDRSAWEMQGDIKGTCLFRKGKEKQLKEKRVLLIAHTLQEDLLLQAENIIASSHPKEMYVIALSD